MLGAAAATAIKIGMTVFLAGSLYVGEQALSDIRSGRVSDLDQYTRKAVAGSVVGFLTGASGLLMAEASLLGVLALGFGEGLVGSIVTQKLLNEDGEIDWGVAIAEAGFSAVTAGFAWKERRSVRGVGGGSEVLESGGKTKLDYVTSNGLVLEATPNRTTTVLGTYKSDTGAILEELGNKKSLDFGPRDGGFNLLNTPDELYVSPNQFWNEYNKPWLDNAIARGDIFKIATEPTWDNLTRINMLTGKTELTGFGREYTYLRQHGYSFDVITKTMSK